MRAVVPLLVVAFLLGDGSEGLRRLEVPEGMEQGDRALEGLLDGGRAGDGEGDLADLLARRRHDLGGDWRVSQDDGYGEEGNHGAHRGESEHDAPPGKATEMALGCPDGRATRWPAQGAFRAHALLARH